jgi:alpha-mannosidase
MAMTLEWRYRLARWREELPRQFYRPLGTVEMAGYVTMAQLTAAEAAEGVFAPMPAGTPWGAKWEYAWFKGQVVLPPEAVGKRIVLRADVGGESAVYVDGVACGAVDREHSEVTLALEGAAGSRHGLMIEAYAGHGARVATVGPLPAGRESVPEPPAQQAVVGETTFGVWEEDLPALVGRRGPVRYTREPRLR